MIHCSHTSVGSSGNTILFLNSRAEVKVMLPSLRVMENRAQFSRGRSQGSPGPCRGQRGRDRDAAKQRTGTLHHTGHNSTLPKFFSGHCVSCIRVRNQVSCTRKLLSSCSVLPLQTKAQGQLLQKGPQRKRGRKQGLAEGERMNGKCSSLVHRTGNYVRENIQLPLGFVHMKPTADLI